MVWWETKVAWLAPVSEWCVLSSFFMPLCWCKLPYPGYVPGPGHTLEQHCSWLIRDSRGLSYRRIMIEKLLSITSCNYRLMVSWRIIMWFLEVKWVRVLLAGGWAGESSLCAVYVGNREPVLAGAGAGAGLETWVLWEWRVLPGERRGEETACTVPVSTHGPCNLTANPGRAQQRRVQTRTLSAL